MENIALEKFPLKKNNKLKKKSHNFTKYFYVIKSLAVAKSWRTLSSVLAMTFEDLITTEELILLPVISLQ